MGMASFSGDGSKEGGLVTLDESMPHGIGYLHIYDDTHEQFTY